MRTTHKAEAIRRCIVSLLVDSEEGRRKIRRALRNKGQDPRATIVELQPITDHVNRTVRVLYHLLPDDLRPTGIPRPQKPRETDHDRPDGLEYRGPTPGGPIPREVRWPGWTIEQILALADAYMKQHGKWPNKNSGRISETSTDTWIGIDLALKRGNRSLPGGTTLAQLLADRRNARNKSSIPPLDIDTILTMADDHYRRTGAWPNVNSGPVIGMPGDTWRTLDRALRSGYRSLPGTTSLARLLAERRDVPNLQGQDHLVEEQILVWADAHFARTGHWPTRDSGQIPEAPGEDWKRVNESLIVGLRGLEGGSSLARFLAVRRGVRNLKALEHLSIDTILIWVDRHYDCHGRWPTCWSGKVEDAPGETWSAVDSAFKRRARGLAECGYRSLAHLLDERRGKLKRRGGLPAERVPHATA